MEDRKQNWCSI